MEPCLSFPNDSFHDFQSTNESANETTISDINQPILNTSNSQNQESIALEANYDQKTDNNVNNYDIYKQKDPYSNISYKPQRKAIVQPNLKSSKNNLESKTSVSPTRFRFEKKYKNHSSIGKHINQIKNQNDIETKHNKTTNEKLEKENKIQNHKAHSSAQKYRNLYLRKLESEIFDNHYIESKSHEHENEQANTLQQSKSQNNKIYDYNKNPHLLNVNSIDLNELSLIGRIGIDTEPSTHIESKKKINSYISKKETNSSQPTSHTGTFKRNQTSPNAKQSLFQTFRMHQEPRPITSDMIFPSIAEEQSFLTQHNQRKSATSKRTHKWSFGSTIETSSKSSYNIGYKIKDESANPLKNINNNQLNDDILVANQRKLKSKYTQLNKLFNQNFDILTKDDQQKLNEINLIKESKPLSKKIFKVRSGKTIRNNFLDESTSLYNKRSVFKPRSLSPQERDRNAIKRNDYILNRFETQTDNKKLNSLKKKEKTQEIEIDFWTGIDPDVKEMALSKWSLLKDDRKDKHLSSTLYSNQSENKLSALDIVPSEVIEYRNNINIIDRFQPSAYLNKILFEEHNIKYQVLQSDYISSKRSHAFADTSNLWKSESLKIIETVTNTIDTGGPVKDNSEEIKKRNKTRQILKERRLLKARQAFKRALTRLILVNRWRLIDGNNSKKEGQKLKIVWEDIHYLPKIRCL